MKDGTGWGGPLLTVAQRIHCIPALASSQFSSVEEGRREKRRRTEDEQKAMTGSPKWPRDEDRFDRECLHGLVDNSFPLKNHLMKLTSMV